MELGAFNRRFNMEGASGCGMQLTRARAQRSCGKGKDTDFVLRPWGIS